MENKFALMVVLKEKEDYMSLKFKNIFSLEHLQYILLALSPILHMYRFVSIVTVGEFALAICVGISIIKHGISLLKFSIPVFIILGYFFIITTINAFLFNSSAANSYKEYFVFLIYYLFAVLLVKDIKIFEFLKIYDYIAIICACFVVLQFVLYTFFKIHISGLIPNVTTYFGNSTNVYIGRINNRCAGFFTEPAMCSRYLAVPFIINIVNKKRILNPKNILYSFAILFTMSGNAIIALIVGYLLVVFFLLKGKNFSEIIKAVSIVLLALITFFLLSKISIFQTLFSRINELNGDSAFSSGYIRVVRGFDAFNNLPLVYKIFGIGFGNYEAAMYLYFYDAITQNTTLVVGWINGIQDYFIYGGLISVILFFILLFPTLFKGDIRLRSASVLFLVYLFVAGMFNEPLWLIFMIMVLSSRMDIFNKKENKIKNDFYCYSYS